MNCSREDTQHPEKMVSKPSTPQSVARRTCKDKKACVWHCQKCSLQASSVGQPETPVAYSMPLSKTKSVMLCMSRCR